MKSFKNDSHQSCRIIRFDGGPNGWNDDDQTLLTLKFFRWSNKDIQLEKCTNLLGTKHFVGNKIKRKGK